MCVWYKIQVALVIFVCTNTFSQSIGEWSIGTLYLNSGDSLKGLLRYELNEELVRVKSAQKEYAFNPTQIKGFWIINLSDSSKREFNVYNFENESGFQVPYIFEEFVSNSKFKVLIREIIQYENRASFVNQGFVPTPSVIENYYFVIGGNILFFNSNKRDVMEIVGDKGDLMMEYIKEKKLKFHKKTDIKLIFEYYYKLL